MGKGRLPRALRAPVSSMAPNLGWDKHCLCASVILDLIEDPGYYGKFCFAIIIVLMSNNQVFVSIVTVKVICFLLTLDSRLRGNDK